MKAQRLDMSTHQRVRRNASPASTGSTKQGPMKAILPVSLMRQASSPTRNNQKNNSKVSLTPPSSNSPTASWLIESPSRVKANRRSPDNRTSPDIRSLGSHYSKEKSRTLNLRSSTSTNSNSSASSSIRRTASLDAIYITGYWPRDVFRPNCGHLMIDKATQTPEEWEELDKKRSPQKKSLGNSENQLEKFIRQRLQRTKEAAVGTHSHYHHHHHHHHHYSHTSPVQGDHSAISINTASVTSEAATNTSRAIPIPIPSISKPLIPRMRSSVEGLNQEIEKLVLKGVSDNNNEDCNIEREPTPDGHRAPIADLFLQGRNVPFSSSTTTTSNTETLVTSHIDVDTQTPCSPSQSRGSADIGGLIVCEESGGSSTTSSSNGSRCQSTSPLVPIIPGLAGSGLDNSRPPSRSELSNYQNGKENRSANMSHSKSASPDNDVNTQTKLGTSPHINKFLEREPPDGCERVNVEELKRSHQIGNFSFCPMKPSMNFVLKPSLGSAFCPLDKGHITKFPEKDNLSHVPVTQPF